MRSPPLISGIDGKLPSMSRGFSPAAEFASLLVLDLTGSSTVSSKSLWHQSPSARNYVTKQGGRPCKGPEAGMCYRCLSTEAQRTRRDRRAMGESRPAHGRRTGIILSAGSHVGYGWGGPSGFSLERILWSLAENRCVEGTVGTN